MLSNLQVCFNAVMPLFLIMGLGYGVKCLGGIRVEDVPGLNKMAFRFFMPVMLFWNLYTSSIDQALQPKLLLFAVGATLVMYGLSLAIVLPTEKDYEKQGVKIQGMYRSNLAIIGLPLATVLVPGADMGPVAMLAAIIVLAIMILPTIMRTTEEALKSVPDSYREGSFGLGAGKLRTIFKIVLPAAVPGILSGVILATGRIVGETAALIYTAGTVAKIPNSAFSSGRTLAVHMYLLANEGLHVNQAYATAVILLILVIGINALSSFIAKKISKA